MLEVKKREKGDRPRYLSKVARLVGQGKHRFSPRLRKNVVIIVQVTKRIFIVGHVRSPKKGKLKASNEEKDKGSKTRAQPTLLPPLPLPMVEVLPKAWRRRKRKRVEDDKCWYAPYSPPPSTAAYITLPLHPLLRIPLLLLHLLLLLAPYTTAFVHPTRSSFGALSCSPHNPTQGPTFATKSVITKRPRQNGPQFSPFTFPFGSTCLRVGLQAQGTEVSRDIIAVARSKADLFEDLQSHARRKEAFETLWNSDFEFSESEYQDLLKACFRLGYVNPFNDLVDEIQRLNVPIALETWTACIYIASSRDFFRLGIACLKRMVHWGVRPDSKAINQVMACCEKKGRGEEAMRLFLFMRDHGVEVPPLTYWALASLLSCGGRWEDFKIVEEDLRKRDFPESIKERFYSTAVVARSGARDWKGSLDMLRRMRECGAVPSIRGFTTALSTCMAAGAYQAVRDFVEEVQGWAIFDLDVATYNVVINSYASERDLEGALAWFEKIHEAGLRPSLISYSTIFKVCASTKRGDLALTFLDRLVREEDLQPSLVTLNHALQALTASQEHFDDARRLLETMEARFGVAPNASTYTSLLRAASEKGDARLALELYHRMKDVAVLAPEPRSIWEVTVACTKSRFFEPLEELVDDLMALSEKVLAGDRQDHVGPAGGAVASVPALPGTSEGGGSGEGALGGGVPPPNSSRKYDPTRSLLYAYSALMSGLEKAGEGELALRLHAHMQAQGLEADTATIVRLLEALNKGRMPERSLKIWSDLEGRREDVRRNVNVTNAVLSAMAAVDPLAAVEFFHDMRDRDQVDDRSYTYAFTAYDNLGDITGVQRLWEEMRVRGLTFDRVSYGSLLRALAHAGEVKQAMEGLRHSENVGVPLNNYTIALTLIGCKRTRQWSTALSMLRELRDERGLSLNVVCYNSVLTVCNAAGQWRACLRLLEEMGEHQVEIDYTSLRVTLNALASAGRYNEVVSLYRRHEELDGVLARKLDTFAFRLIANAFIKVDPVAAVSMIKKHVQRFSGGAVRSGAGDVPVGSSQPGRHQYHRSSAGSPARQFRRGQEQSTALVDSRLYKSLITALGHKGEWEQAVQVLQALEPPLRDISTISATASALLRSEQYSRARDLLLEAEETVPGAQFDGVADSLGLQAAYMAEDYAQAGLYLDRLIQAGNHGNSSANFGFCLLAKQGKWQELSTLLLDISRLQEEHGRRYIVSRTTLETFANLTSWTLDSEAPGGMVKSLNAEGSEGEMEHVEPAVLANIMETVCKMSEAGNLENATLGFAGTQSGMNSQTFAELTKEKSVQQVG